MGGTLETTMRAAEIAVRQELAKERRRWVTFAWKTRQLWFRKKAIAAVIPSSEDSAFTEIWLSGPEEPFVTDESLSAVLEKLGLEQKEERT